MSAAHSVPLSIPPLSRRAESLGTENAFVVLAEVNALVREGRDIVSFCIGQPDFPTPPNVQNAAIAAIHAGKHGYTPSAGIDELRAAAAKDIGVAARRRGEAGGRRRRRRRQAVHRVHDRVGDRLRRRRRGDLSGAGVPDLRIADRRQWCGAGADLPARVARSFAFDPAELEAKITPKTRLLILNTPHNPTGGMLHAADLDAIAAILRQHPHVWVYADEIYSRLAYAGPFDTLATRPGMLERTIISDGASKTWAMTGWRIGFAANRALAPVFTRWITNTDSCASQISQWAAVEAVTGSAGRSGRDARRAFASVAT